MEWGFSCLFLVSLSQSQQSISRKMEPLEPYLGFTYLSSSVCISFMLKGKEQQQQTRKQIVGMWGKAREVYVDSANGRKEKEQVWSRLFWPRGLPGEEGSGVGGGGGKVTGRKKQLEGQPVRNREKRTVSRTRKKLLSKAVVKWSQRVGYWRLTLQPSEVQALKEKCARRRVCSAEFHRQQN